MMMKTATAVAVLVKTNDGNYRLGHAEDIKLGEPVHLLLPDGMIARTSRVKDYFIAYAGHYFYIDTQHTRYSLDYYSR